MAHPLLGRNIPPALAIGAEPGHQQDQQGQDKGGKNSFVLLHFWKSLGRVLEESFGRGPPFLGDQSTLAYIGMLHAWAFAGPISELNPFIGSKIGRYSSLHPDSLPGTTRRLAIDVGK